jgi:hypothetical protein
MLSHASMPSKLDCLVSFQNKYIIDSTTNCWNCIGYKDKNGYGFITINKKHYRIHRISYFIYNGPFDLSLQILHSCDNPSCCNPKHLFIGDQFDNMQDCVNKGRLNPGHGENKNNSKFTNQKIIEIREKYLKGVSIRKLGKEYNVDHGHISKIINYKIWKHI